MGTLLERSTGPLDAVLAPLERRGCTLVGPTVRDRAIVLEEIDSTAELKAGWTDVQEPARSAPRIVGSSTRAWCSRFALRGVSAAGRHGLGRTRPV